MALEAPLRSSTGSIASRYLSYADMPLSAGSESSSLPSQYMAYGPHQSLKSQRQILTVVSHDRSSSGHDPQSLRPNSFMRPSSAHLMSPSSDIVGPSPVTSNGTATTEIDDEAADNAEEENGQVRRSLMMLRTNIPDHIRRPVNEEVVSVIHAPPSFQNWSSDAVSRSNSASVTSVESTSASSPPPSEPSTVVRPPSSVPACPPGRYANAHGP
jgi:hypothetical protein